MDAQRTTTLQVPSFTPVTLPSLSTVATSVSPDAKKHFGFASVGVTDGVIFCFAPTFTVASEAVTSSGSLSLLAGVYFGEPAVAMVQVNAPSADASPWPLFGVRLSSVQSPSIVSPLGDVWRNCVLRPSPVSRARLAMKSCAGSP